MMIAGSTMGAGLVLLVVLCEAASGFLWHDGTEDVPHHYCPGCDLRYRRHELTWGGERRCPRGHLTASEERFSWTVALVSACVTVIALGLIGMLAGVPL